MEEVIVLFVLGLAWIIAASVEDIKKREVANWISFSLIIFALGFRLFYSLFSNSGFGFFYQGLIGLGVFLILGNILYYARMFAGGDAKLMIALGPILGFSTSFAVNLKIYAFFLFLFLLVGAVYGLVITIFISFKHFKCFKIDFNKRIKNKGWLKFVMILGLAFLVLGFFETMIFFLGILTFIFPYFYFYAKSVDSSCMVREVNTKDLTEGEWLYEKLQIGKKIIKPSWEGISKEDLKTIRKKYKKIKIRHGIPFVPVFLIAFLILYYLWETGLWYSFW